MTVRELMEYLDTIEDKDQIVVVYGKRKLFAKAKATKALMSPGYNWAGPKERPAILIGPACDRFGDEDDGFLDDR
jgi:hypothetical protein